MEIQDPFGGQVDFDAMATTAAASPSARVRVIVRANGTGKIGTGNYVCKIGPDW